MINILKLLISHGFNLDFIQFLIRFDQVTLDKLIEQILNAAQAEEVLSIQPVVPDAQLASFIASLDPTAAGFNPSISSGFGHLVFIPLANNYHYTSEGTSPDISSDHLETANQHSSYSQHVMYYVPTTITAVITEVTPPAPPVKTGTLAAWVNITQMDNLFHSSTARDTISSTNYSVEGQTINYAITATTVDLTALGQWGDINTILFTGDPYDLANKELTFANFKSVNVDMIDSPLYSSLPKLGLTLSIDGVKEGTIEASSVADTITIKHSTDNSPGTFVINTLDGNDTVFIQPSTITYSVNNIPNINSGLGITNQIDTGKGDDLVNSSTSLSQNQIVLGDGDDTAYIGGGDDFISGNAGNDLIYGGGGNDQLDGNEDNDTLYGEAGNDMLHGNEGDDTLYGNGGDDVIYGDDGNDTIEGGEGINYLDGGAGDDVFRVNASETGNNEFQGGLGTNEILAEANAVINLNETFNAANSIQLITGATTGTNTIQGKNTDTSWDFSATTLTDIDLIQTGSGNDNVTGSFGNDAISGGQGNDVLKGNEGDDTISGDAGNDFVEGNTGDDTLFGNDGDDTLYGNEGDDTLYGNDGHDTIYGGNDNDTIVGGSGTNYLDGGAGDDTFRVNASETGDNYFQGGSGTNQIVAAENATINLNQTFNASNSIQSITGAATGTNIIQGKNTVNTWDFSTTTLTDIDLIQTGSSNDNVRGSLGTDTINGGQGNDNLKGNDGDDIIYGDAGNDFIEGNNGNNTLYGGTGVNTFNVNAGETGFNSFYGGTAGGGDSDSITAAVGATIYITQNFSYSNNSIEKITGATTGINTIQGDNTNNIWDLSYLTATTMTNIDFIKGGNANDTITGSQGADVIEGNGGNDLIYGNAGNDTLRGNDGDDTIYGDAGNDTIEGGNGINVMYGGTGVNTFKVNANETGLNTFYGGTSATPDSDTITFAVGATLYLSENFSSVNSIERFTGATSGINIIQGQDNTGSTWNFSYLTATTMTNIDVIKGGNSNDTIIGSQGADVIEGNGGNDMLLGNSGNDTLRGNDGDDTIYGDAGNDTIEGGNGINVMYGGTGVNTFKVNANETGLNTFYGGTGATPDSDTITFAVGATLYLSENFSSVNSIERITGASSGINTIQGQDGIVNNWDFSYLIATMMTNIDFIKGGNENDIIRGSLGVDVIEGNAGNDILYGNAGNDTLRGNEGNDTIYGSDGNDTIYGDNGDDIIEGNSGTNTMDGGAGNDIFRINANETSINTFQGGTGSDQIIAATDFAIIYLNALFNTANSIEEIKGLTNTTIQGQNSNKTWDFSATALTDISAINIGNGTSNTVTGSSIADVINGGTGVDTINGNSGDDLVHGYGGNDILRGNDGDDTIYGDDGNDTIEGGLGNNYMDGGLGNDIFRIYATDTGINTFQGGLGTDQIVAALNATIYLNQTFNFTNSIEQINGASGASTNILQGQDNVEEDWNFSLTTLTNIDAIQTGDGNDNVTGSVGNDIIHGNAGNDSLYGYNGNDTIYGDDGNDIIEGGNGTNTMYGGEGDDTFRVNANETGLNTFQGGNGTDQIYALSNATIFLNTTFNATNSIEQINGTASNIIQGRDGVNENWDFSATTINSVDLIQTGTGNDIVTGSVGNDTIDGGAGNDTLRGNNGNDTIYGRDGADRLYGDAGNDTIDAGKGNDICDGGADIDLAIMTYDFSSYTRSYNATTKIETLTNTVSGTETDTYVNFEFFNFNGVLYSFNNGVFTLVTPPIVMDLNGDGVHYSSAPLLFDMNNDGLMDKTYWADSEDGVLTYDKNHDGTLTDVNEISFAQYQEGARTDLEGLRAFDTNHNNQLDINDAEWNSFGVTQNNQFLTLGELNINSISLQSDNNFQLVSNGVIEFGQGNFTYADGTIGKLADVAFGHTAVLSDATNSIDTLLNSLGPTTENTITPVNTVTTEPQHAIAALPSTPPELDPIIPINDVA